MSSGPGASRARATCAASLAGLIAGLLGLSACAGSPSRDAERAHRELARAISRGDAEGVASRVHPALGSPETLLETGRALDLADDELAATHTDRIWSPAPGEVERLVWAEGGWRIDRDVSELFPADTPRRALASFCRATRLERWDVVVAFAPRRLREGLDSRAVERAWSASEQGDALRAARDLLESSLLGPLFEDAQAAVLLLPDGRAAHLEREGQRWVIVDF